MFWSTDASIFNTVLEKNAIEAQNIQLGFEEVRIPKCTAINSKLYCSCRALCLKQYLARIYPSIIKGYCLNIESYFFTQNRHHRVSVDVLLLQIDRDDCLCCIECQNEWDCTI